MQLKIFLNLTPVMISISGNVLKEICYPAGALIRRSGFQLGDPTLSIMEIWGAEYQESNALLVKSKDAEILKQIAHREKCPVSFVGSITDDKRVSRVVYLFDVKLYFLMEPSRKSHAMLWVSIFVLFLSFYFCGPSPDVLLKLWLHTARGCNLQSLAYPSYNLNVQLLWLVY